MLQQFQQSPHIVMILVEILYGLVVAYCWETAAAWKPPPLSDPCHRGLPPGHPRGAHRVPSPTLCVPPLFFAGRIILSECDEGSVNPTPRVSPPLIAGLFFCSLTLVKHFSSD